MVKRRGQPTWPEGSSKRTSCAHVALPPCYESALVQRDREDPPERLGAPELLRLAAKYQALGDLRRARARGEPIPDRQVFRALAAEFPGALHELDHLPLAEIDRRLLELTAAASGGGTMATMATVATMDWMAWMWSYHALMRAALYVKLRVSRARPAPDEEAAALARRAAAHAGIAVDVGFVRAVEAPPGGRLRRVVMARLAARFGVPEATLREALFPRRAASAPDAPDVPDVDGA